MIASEELIPGLGLDYQAFEVLAQPGVDSPAIWDVFATTYESEVADAGGGQDFTLSMFDINQSGAIQTAISQFVSAAAADVSVNPTPYLQAASAVHHYPAENADWDGYVDLGEYVTNLTGVSSDVVAARDNLLATIAAARVGQHNGTPAFDSATGMTVYFPNEPRLFLGEFRNLVTAGPWAPFLDSYYIAQAGVVLQTDTRFSAETLSITNVDVEESIYEVAAPVAENFVGSVQLAAATTDANGVRTFFKTDDGEVNDDGTASAHILPSLTTVSDGTRKVVLFTRYVHEQDGVHGYSTFALRRASGSVAQLNWDRRGDTGPLTIIDENGVVLAYTPQPGDLAYPVSRVQQLGGVPQLIATNTPLDPNRQWTVTDELIPAGTEIYLELWLLDATGNVIDNVTGTMIAGQS
jgi:hypothetical protein